MKILFIGNSYTFFNDMPSMFSELLAENGRKAQVDSVTKGGRKLFENLDENDANHQKIAEFVGENEYDVLFLQEQSQLPALDETKFFEGVKGVMELVKAKKTVLYATWGRKEGSHVLDERGWTSKEMFSKITSAYSRAAKEFGTDMSCVGDCFLYLTENAPELEIYNDDKSHPSYIGSCVAAIAHYKTLFGELPSSFSACKISSDELEIIKTAVDKVI